MRTLRARPCLLLCVSALVGACVDFSGTDDTDGGPGAGPLDAGVTGPDAPATADAGASGGSPDAGMSDGGAPGGGAGPEAPSPYPVGMTDDTIEVAGVTRQFRVHVPPVDARPRALVFVLHGGGGEGLDVARPGEHPLAVFRAVADREGFVVVYPGGLPSGDAAGRAGWVDCRADNELAGGADDVAFLATLVERVRGAYGLSAEDVFLAGTSNGGQMAHAFAFHHADRVGAVATHAGSLPETPLPGPCTAGPSRPLPILIAHGTADTQMPWAGGCVADLDGTCSRGRVVSAEATRDRWLRINGLSAVAPTVALINESSTDAGPAHRWHYAGAAPLQWWRLEGAGHTVPSRSVVRAPNPLSGVQNQDVEFAEVAWAFFASRGGSPDAAPEVPDAGTPSADAGPPGPLAPGNHPDLSLPAPFPMRRFDAVVPDGDDPRAVIFLHGGGGNKGGIANQLGISSLPPAERDQLGILWLFPQGRAIAEGPATWENHVMTSGANDVLFLAALAQYAKAELGAREVVLAGHSNGGMMVHRMWCESAAPIDAFLSVAGPPSVRYDADTGDLACPGTRPYWAMVGDQDQVLQTSGAGLAPTWEIRPALVAQSPGAFLNPVLVNELRAHRTLRAPQLCPGTALQAPTAGARYTEWSDCGGQVRFRWVHAQMDYPAAGLGNHPIGQLEADGSFQVRDLLSTMAW